MAWGGAGGGAFGPGGTQTSAAAGLPFAGVPEELRTRAEAILEREPEHPEPNVRYEARSSDDRPFTLRRFLAAHRMGLALAIALVVVETLALQVGPLLTQRGIDDGIAKGSTQTLVVIAIVYIFSVVVSIVAGSLRVAWTGRLGERLLYDLRIRVFSHLQRLSIDFYTDEKAGRVLTRMTSDIEALQQLFQDGLVNLAVQVLTMVVVTIILFTLQPTMAAITVLAVVPAMAAVTIWFRIASDRAYGVVRDRIADVLSDLSESLSGIRVITAFNRRRNNIYAHRNIVGRYRDANVQTAEINARYGPATDIIGSIGQVVVLAVGGKMVLDQSLSIGELTAFVLYLTAFFAPIQQLVQLYSTYQSGQAAVVKLRDLLGTRPSVAEAADARPLPAIDGRIVLEHVTFGYGATPVLHDVSLAIAPGETFALVGETGSGKSTIAKLVCRFYDPDAGRILLDGHDLRDLTLASLRRQLGVVPQEPFLFAGTLRDNAAFGRPEATDAEVLEACRAVGLDDLLDRLPSGIDSPVHERGTSLSSGERQLLALARAFLARPRVLVLDEATSNLDLKSESQIERALDAVLDGRTAILIAHRLATAMRADRIAVVHDGEIVELGSHDELVAMGGRYGAMYDTWLSHTGVDGRTPLPRATR
jgi:ATP-binding cassette, subfamily B, bacterial